MAKEIRTEIAIQASVARVWAVFADFARYPEWNPFIKSLTGQPRPGARIRVRLEPPNAKGMTFKPKVLAFEAHKTLRWQGHLLFPGLFDGEHVFELVDLGNGSTKFIQRENFGGILVPLFRKMLDGSTVEGFRQMNQKLKELVEQEG